MSIETEKLRKYFLSLVSAADAGFSAIEKYSSLEYADCHKSIAVFAWRIHLLRAEILLEGIVQGVGFRPFVYRCAVRNRLVGYVQNRQDAGITIVVEGSKRDVKRFIDELKSEKPPLARIDNLTVKYGRPRGEFTQFRIMKSSRAQEIAGSVVPPDIAICQECLKELRDQTNRRHEYFFITCTDCGPRYTTISDTPYDRPNTTMQRFAMCKLCRREYVNPADRRFHAQTIACAQCGPTVYLTDNDGDPVRSDDPIRDASRLLDEGYILAIKGNGGFHIASATTRDDPIVRLRRVKHRAQKPFAIMARDLETVKSFAYVNSKEAELLESYVKPIVLLRKRKEFFLSDLIAPGLFNVGVMLPYTGQHFMLFEDAKEPAFIMTSGNPPDEPIATGNSEVLKKLGPQVDFFLFHDREIAQRCDDSVVRVVGKNTLMIRRSRGYAPAPIYVDAKVDGCVLGVGGELNVTCCLLTQKKAFLSQHIGDIETPDTLQFLKQTIKHLSKLTRSKITSVACDLHPGFQTTKLALEISQKNQVPVVKVQHHHAHIAKLMAENDLDEAIGIACDGFGYGQDGRAWGGEVLHCSSNRYERIGHLEEHLMPGGDLATKYPLRMVASILSDVEDISGWLSSRVAYFPHGGKEIEIVLTELERKKGPYTSSCGRVLDAVSALLGICYSRTYEGEAAMKLESSAAYGKDTLRLQPRIRGQILDTRFLLEEVYRSRDSLPVVDLACSAQSYLARGLAELATSGAERLGVRTIGFSGGVAYNEQFTLTMRNYVEEREFRFIMHNRVPPGDAGISFGQAVVASKTS